MNRNAFKMISLAAVGTFSAAAMAVTAVAPRVGPVAPAPTMVSPNQVQQKSQFQAVDLKAANDDVAGETCNEQDQYNGAIEGTRSSFNSVKTSVQYGALNVAVGNCGKSFNSMSPEARGVAEDTAECVVRHDVKSADMATKETVHGECLLDAKVNAGLIQPANDNRADAIAREKKNAKDVANTCGYFPMIRDAA